MWGRVCQGREGGGVEDLRLLTWAEAERLHDRVLQPNTKYYRIHVLRIRGAERIDSVGLRSASIKYLRLAGHTVTITT